MQQKSYGLAKETGSFVCQRCGLYFERHGDETVCPTCKKTKSKPNSINDPFIYENAKAKSFVWANALIITFAIMIFYILVNAI